MVSIRQFDIVIIGAGGAGLVSAITAFDSGTKNIAILSKITPNHSHTVAAKGGINATLGNVSSDDWRWHAFDTIKGSGYLADQNAVDILCANAVEAILFLEKQGMVFSRDADGKIMQRTYGGQTTDYGNGGLAHRACYAQDKTGHSLLHTLLQQVKKRQIAIFSDFLVLDLLVENNICYGCLALDLAKGELIIFASKILILASGGYSQIYKNTTSALTCTGDGTALALRAGIVLQDMEFVQFHPTGIANSGILISEAARSEGAYLLNKNMYRFMYDYEPKMLELACRDTISLAMAHEIQKGNGGPNNCLYLDLRHLDNHTLAQKLPAVVEVASKFAKVDVRTDLIPVAPSAHYSMGGVPCSIDCLVVDGLMAVGEVACLSVHGANRLGCNSLLDLVVFGKIAGENASKIITQSQMSTNNCYNLAKTLAQSKIADFNKILQQPQNVSIAKIRVQMQENNEQTIGIFRNAELLQQGFANNLQLYKQLLGSGIGNSNLIYNDELVYYLETVNLLLNSLAVAYSAKHRCESRGAHYRSDFCQSSDDFLAHSLVRLKSSDDIDFIFSLKERQ
jgi:succinate dehydrogenase / fumarate reductase flavoprotein subunit